MHRFAPPLVVGFDLDMTLIDPRRGVRTALHALAEESGVDIDVELIVSSLGPPLETALSPWFDGDALDRACWRYRDLHGALLFDHTDPMPGAVEAVAAVRNLGGTVIVVTAKYEPHARISLTAVGIEANLVVGWKYGPAKGEVLRHHKAQIYVGDHPADVIAAQVAGSFCVAVATGEATPSTLRAAGAEVVLADLLGFPRWLERWLESGAD
ncbi:MAG TPA: HAD hydrolase-like protein [Acidimicrobiales bacterium]|nr:HAD hydrolase-like protein [Acidimicrobiales bacterium]